MSSTWSQREIHRKIKNFILSYSATVPQIENVFQRLNRLMELILAVFRDMVALEILQIEANLCTSSNSEAFVEKP